MAAAAGKGLMALLGRGVAGTKGLLGGPLGMALMALMFWPELQSILKNAKKGARSLPGGRALLGPGEQELAAQEKQVAGKAKAKEDLTIKALVQLLAERESQAAAREGPGEEYFASVSQQQGLQDIAGRFNDTAAPRAGEGGTQGTGLIQTEDEADQIQSALQSFPVDEDDPSAGGVSALLR